MATQLIDPRGEQTYSPPLKIEPTAVTTSEIEIKLYPSWFKDVTMSWTIPSTWGGAVFNVYRSAAKESGYEKLNTVSLVGTSFTDHSTRQDSKHRVDYYIVQAVVPGLGVFESYPKSISEERFPLPELRAREVMRREWLLLRKFVGVDVLYLQKKTYGERCNTCWSEKMGKVVRPNCPDCLGTSFKEGYFPGIQTKVQFEPNNDDVTPTEAGDLELHEDASCWTPAVLDMSPRDVLIKLKEFVVYRIEVVQKTELQTVPVRHILRLQELAHEHPTYKLLKREGLIP